MAAILICGLGSRASGHVQTLDRVVASVGKTAITESDVLKEYHLERFMDDGQVPADPPGLQELQKLRTRLIDQKLLETEAGENSAEADLAAEEARKRLVTLEKKFPSAEAFQAALRPLGITKQQLFEKLAKQQQILHIVDDRLRPAAVVDAAEIKDYYQRTLLPELARDGNRNPPPLPEVAVQIREVLVQQKINQLLAGWLSQLRSERHVELLPM